MDLASARIQFQENAPHTFNAMQALVMAMEKALRSRGQKTFFGHDKSKVSYQEFLEKLQDTLRSLVLDGLLEESDDGVAALDSMRLAIQAFGTAFPNWPDAYEFAREFFGNGNKANAIAVIERLR